MVVCHLSKLLKLSFPVFKTGLVLNLSLQSTGRLNKTTAMSDAQKPGEEFWHCLCLKASVVGLHLLFQKSLEGLSFVGKVIFIHFNNVTHVGR